MALYDGGGTLVVKNVGGHHMDKNSLDGLCAIEGIRDVKAYYVLDKGGFVYLRDSMHIGHYFVEGIMRKGGNHTFYADCKTFQHIEVGQS